MAKTRSPNYPSIDLDAAIKEVEAVYKKEVRNKMSRPVLAAHLGYTSLNGRSLSMIGALRQYGLIEGSGDENRVSEDAITLLQAPHDSPDRLAALERCAFRPSLFSELHADFPDGASSENLRYALVKRQFTPEAAGKAVNTYASNILLLSEYNGGKPFIKQVMPPPAADTLIPPPASPPSGPSRSVLQQSERELVTGGLSGDARFRLIVSGAVGSKELARLIKKLEMEKEIAEEAEEAEARRVLGLPPKEGVFN